MKSIFAICLAILCASCATVRYDSETYKLSSKETSTLVQDGCFLPILSLKISGTKTGATFGNIGFIPYYIPHINDDLVTLEMIFVNLSRKKIDEIRFTVTPYSSDWKKLDDSTAQTVRINYDEPVTSGKKITAKFAGIWENKLIDKVMVDRITIVFEDGEGIAYDEIQTRKMCLYLEASK